METQLKRGEPIPPPKNVIYAIVLLGLSIFLALAPGFACKYIDQTEILGNIPTVLFAFVLTGSMWFMLYMLTKGAMWVRTIFLIFYCIGVVCYLPVLFYYFSVTPVAGLLSLFQTILQVIAIILLFSHDSTEWHKEQTKVMDY